MKNLTNKIIVSFLFTILSVLTFSTLNGEETKFRDQAWRFGLNAGLQFNSVSLGYQNLHEPFPNFSSNAGRLKDNSDGKGMGLYGGIVIDYLSDSWWGIQIRNSYDVRDALVKDTTTGPPSGRLKGVAFDTYMNYLSWELLFRVDQKLIPNLGIFFGPIFAINIHGTYDYKADMDGPVTEKGVKVQNRNDVPYGITGGLAYDIELSRKTRTSFYLTPFAEASWIVNQKKSDYYPEQNSVTDVWSTLSLRFGIRASWELRNPKEPRLVEERIVYVPTPQKVADPGKRVLVIMPTDNTIYSKSVNGYFPIHPYVFFEKGSQEIPSRYVMLSKTDAQNFKETDLENFRKNDMTVKEMNVNQLMVTYYNVLNIYGDRMRNNPNEQLTLRGCDPVEKDGEAYANKVKTYLVNNFGIDPNRIKIIVEPPQKISGSALTDPAFSSMIDDENRRVVFVFSNQDMYKPVPYTIREESSIDNDMIFSINDNVKFKNWTIAITGENKTMNFGPFKSNWERINPTPLMRGLDEGKFNAKVNINLQDGKQVSEDVDFKLYKERELKNASRYLMIFDYNKSDPVMVYETKIRKEIVPGMNTGNRVIVHGHTDIIGNEEGNQKLSQERADQAKKIIDNQLGRDNKKIDVQALGTGQSIMQYTFDNQYPEGRMYNRNVFVEVIK